MPDVDDELVWKGAWTSGASYAELDAVSSGSTVYVCIAAHAAATENAPPNGDFWELAVDTSRSYASLTEYKAYVGKTSDDKDTQIAIDLDAASRHIERILHGRVFTKDSTPVARVFVPKSSRPSQPGWAESENPWKYGGMSRVLDIDDLVSVTSIAIDENRDNTFSLTLTTNDYELLPRNASVKPEVEPYHQIELTSWGSVYAWPKDARVRITGIWGWPSVPSAIKLACIKWTAISRNEGPEATGQILNFDQAVQQTDDGRRIAYLYPRDYTPPVSF